MKLDKEFKEELEASMKDMDKFIFDGKILYFVGEAGIENGGALATKEQYLNFLIPHAHLYPDGNIKRAGKIIGNKKDLKLLIDGDEA